jgi:hypothetical protein
VWGRGRRSTDWSSHSPSPADPRRPGLGRVSSFPPRSARRTVLGCTS